MYDKNFNKAEQIERMYLNKITEIHNCWRIKKVYENDYNSWDADVELGDLTILLEVKVRNISVDRYEDAILEKSKVDHIHSVVEQHQDKYKEKGKRLISAYLAVYPKDNVALLFMTKMISKEGIENMPETTVGKNKYIVPTEVYYYPIKLAKVLKI